MSALDEDAPRSLVENFRSIFLGRLISALSMWLALVILAKLSDPATVGIYALAQAICIPISEIAKMSLREMRSSDTASMFRFGDYLGLRLVATGIALIMMAGVALATDRSGTLLLVITLYALVRGVEMIADIVHGLFQAHERMEFIGRSLCLVGPASLLLLGSGYALTGSLPLAVAGQLAAHLAVLAFYDLPRGWRRMVGVTDTFRPIWEGRTLARLALLAMPLTIATMLLMIAQHLPRFAVEQFLGLAGLGIFAAIMSLSLSPDRLIQSLGMAVSVRLATLFARHEMAGFLRLLAILVAGVLGCGLTGIAFCVAFGEDILRVVYTDAYADQSEVFVILAVAVSLRLITNVFGFGLIATRGFWWLTAQSGVAAATAVVACLVLIPRMGLNGAALSVLLVFAAQFATALLGLTIVVLSAERRIVT